MTAFSLGSRLHLGANSTLALSLPQSFVAAKRRQKPAPSSEGAEAAPAADRGGYLGGAQGAAIGAVSSSTLHTPNSQLKQARALPRRAPKLTASAVLPPPFSLFKKFLKLF